MEEAKGALRVPRKRRTDSRVLGSKAFLDAGFTQPLEKNGVQISLGKGARKRCLPMQNGAVVKSLGEVSNLCCTTQPEARMGR